MHQTRIGALKAALANNSLSAIAILPGASLRYLTGLDLHLYERPIVGLFPVEGKPILIVPDLELESAKRAQDLVDVIGYPEEIDRRTRIFRQTVEERRLNRRRLGVEPLSMRFLEETLILDAAPGVELVPADSLISKLRMEKEPQEIDAMRVAAEIAENAISEVLPGIALGMSERELANRIVIELLKAGSDPELPFSPIVASGPNSALPHATAGDRRLASGDLLLIDWGATHAGYMSDITRTYCLGEPDSQVREAYAAVLAANRAARDAVAPGVRCQEIDWAARSVIEQAGLGQAFLHRTGHGLGLEPHEPPSIQSDNELVLAEGMTFTIEPGVYLSGRGGVRIEDDIVVTQDGCKSLTTLDRELVNLL